MQNQWSKSLTIRAIVLIVTVGITALLSRYLPHDQAGQLAPGIAQELVDAVAVVLIPAIGALAAYGRIRLGIPPTGAAGGGDAPGAPSPHGDNTAGTGGGLLRTTMRQRLRALLVPACAVALIVLAGCGGTWPAACKLTPGGGRDCTCATYRIGAIKSATGPGKVVLQSCDGVALPIVITADHATVTP